MTLFKRLVQAANIVPAPEVVPKDGATKAFWPSLVQSFLLIFLSEIADRTFILVIIYSLRMHWLPLILASFLSMVIMNALAITVGYMVPLLIVKDVVDWIGFACFLFFGIYSLYDGLKMESKSVNEAFKEEMKENEDKYSQVSNIEEEEENKNSKGSKKKTLFFVCLELIGFMMLSELGDKSEITTITVAALYNVYGVFIGTSLAYLITIMIGAFIGNIVGEYITEKMMSIIGGILFICFAVEILISKLFF